MPCPPLPWIRRIDGRLRCTIHGTIITALSVPIRTRIRLLPRSSLRSGPQTCARRFFHASMPEYHRTWAPASRLATKEPPRWLSLNAGVRLQAALPAMGAAGSHAFDNLLHRTSKFLRPLNPKPPAFLPVNGNASNLHCHAARDRDSIPAKDRDLSHSGRRFTKRGKTISNDQSLLVIP